MLSARALAAIRGPQEHRPPSLARSQSSIYQTNPFCFY